MRQYFACVALILSITAISCVADAQDVYRKSIFSGVVNADYYKIDLENLNAGERYEISVTPMQDFWGHLSGCGYKIYKWSEVQSQLDEVKSDWANPILGLIFAPHFNINDISANSTSTGHYYLLFTTKTEFELCVSAMKILELCGRTEPGTNIDWEVQATKLIDIKTAETWNQKAKLHLNNDEFEEAIEDLNYALEINPRLADALNNRGLAWAALGTLDSAIVDFESAVKIDSNFADAWYNYGFYLSEEGRYKEAILSIGRAMSLDQHIRETKKEIISEIFYKYACSLIDQGMTIEAVEVLIQSEEIDPGIIIRHKETIGETLYKKGLILSGRDEYFNATLVMDRAIRVDPAIQEKYGLMIFQIWYKLSKEFFDQANFKAACDAAERAIEINPSIKSTYGEEISKYYLLLGNALLDQRNYEGATAAYNRSSEINPEIKDKISEYCCNIARNLTHQKQLNDAVIAYEMAESACPDSVNSREIADAWFLLGRSLRESKRCQAAISAFDKVLGYSPDNQMALTEKEIALENINAGICS